MTGRGEEWFSETLYASFGQRFEVTNTLFRSSTEHQDLMIFETPFFGRVLALDGVIQTTERDEAAYHEMLSHVPIFPTAYQLLCTNLPQLLQHVSI